jgi:hypothetical protein
LIGTCRVAVVGTCVAVVLGKNPAPGVELAALIGHPAAPLVVMGDRKVVGLVVRDQVVAAERVAAGLVTHAGQGSLVTAGMTWRTPTYLVLASMTPPGHTCPSPATDFSCQLARLSTVPRIG